MEVKGTLKYRKVQRTPQTGENAGKKKKWYATSVTDRSPRCITHRGLFYLFTFKSLFTFKTLPSAVRTMVMPFAELSTR